MTVRLLAKLTLVAVLVLAAGACSRQAQEKRHLEAGLRYEKEGDYIRATLEYENAARMEPKLADAHVGLARVLWQQEDYLGSMAELELALQLSPHDTEALIRMGRIYLLTNKLADAKEEAQAALAADPNNAEAQVLNGLVLLRSGDGSGAQKVFQQVLSKQNKDVGAWMGLAAYYNTKDDTASAENALKQAAAAEPHDTRALLALAGLYEGLNQPAQAEHAYAEAAQRQPRNLSVLIPLAALYQRTEKPSQAEATIKQVRNLAGPDNPHRTDLADYYLGVGNEVAAIAELQTLIHLDGLVGPAGRKLGDVLLDEGKVQDAQAWVQKMRHATPTSAEAEYLDGRIQLIQGNPTKALSRFQQAESRQNIPQLFYFEGLSFLAEGNNAEARSAFDTSLSLDSQYGPARLERGKLELAGGDLEGAIADARILLQTRPTVQACLLYVGALARNGQGKQAVQFLTEVLKKATQADARAAFNEQLALFSLSSKGYTQAREALEEAHSAAPNSSLPKQLLAYTYVVENQLPEAEQVLSAAGRQYPSDLQVEVLLAQVLTIEHKFDQAEAAYNLVLRAHPDVAGAEIGLAELAATQGHWADAGSEFEKAAEHTQSAEDFVRAGQAWEKVGQEDIARQDYIKASKLDPKNAVALNNLSWIYLKQDGNVDVAVSYAEQAKQLMPQSPPISDTLAWAYYHKNHYAFAASLLEEAIRADPNTGVFYYHLGMCDLKLDRRTDAQRAFQQALRLGGTFPKENVMAELERLERSR